MRRTLLESMNEPETTWGRWKPRVMEAGAFLAIAAAIAGTYCGVSCIGRDEKKAEPVKAPEIPKKTMPYQAPQTPKKESEKPKGKTKRSELEVRVAQVASVKVDVNSYDGIIDKVLGEYEERIGSLPSDKETVKKYVKAMMITESSTTPEAFLHDPMQITNVSDPAYGVLVRGDEGTDLITSPEFRRRLATKTRTPWVKTTKGGHRNYSNSNMDAETSIEGGIAWFLHYAANYKMIVVEDGVLSSYSIRKGDTLDKIAKGQNTTTETIMKYNPKLNPKNLKIGVALMLKPAKKVEIVGSWKDLPSAVERYNGVGSGAGDPRYMEKINDALERLNNDSQKQLANLSPGVVRLDLYDELNGRRV
jgi:hypothetical protein